MASASLQGLYGPPVPLDADARHPAHRPRADQAHAGQSHDAEPGRVVEREQVMFGTVIEPAFLNGVGPRLEVHGLGMIANHAYSGPYEDLRLNKR